MKSKRLIALLMSPLMLLSLVPPSVTASAAESDFSAPEQMTVTSLSTSNIAPGITQDNLVTRDKETGAQTKSYIAKIDSSVLYGENKSAGFLAGYSDYKMEPGKWKMATVRDQAAACEKETGKNVVFAMNADYFNMQTGQPSGLLVMNGKEICSALNADGNPREVGYFGLTKNGEYVLRDGTVDASDIEEGIGSPIWLVRNGENLQPRFANVSSELMPRAAVGKTPDGSLVFMVADGRQNPKSTGICLHDVAGIMISYGCTDVLYLDGGGSATFASKSEGTNELTVKNSPSDGTERKVSSSLFIYSDAKPTGVFDHASITPANELYTPNSEVQFEAIGVDSVGGSAELPTDGAFVLDETSTDLGSITPEGKFLSNGKTGTVKVNYMSSDKVCGSTTIEIVVPDTLYVGNTEQAVGPGVVTDFGIVAKNKNRDVIMKDGDLVWSIVDSTTQDDLNGKAGTFNGLTFTGTEDGTYNATITAKFNGAENINIVLTVFIGSKSVNFYDFEYTTDKQTAEADENLKYIPSMKLPVYGQTLLSELGKSNASISSELHNEEKPLYMWPNKAITNDSVNATIVSSEDGEPVRFGKHALRIDFDYSSYDWSSNANFYLRATEPDYAFEGSPTAIGCWVYVPEGTTSYNLYLNCARQCDVEKFPDSNFNLAYDSFKINWTGWKYLEFDLTGTKSTTGAGVGSANAPFGLYQGCGIFWISYQPGTMGHASADTIYLDDMTLIYGANTSDTINPEISHIGTMTDEIEDSKTVFDSNTNTFRAVYADAEDKYMSGINDDLTKMYIDGVDVTDKCMNVPTDGTIYYYDAYLADGVHCLEVEVTDKAGNTTTEMRYFTVEGKAEETVTELAALNSPVLGQDYNLVVRTNNPQDILSADIDIKVLSTYRRYWRDITVVPSENYEFAEDGTAKYNSGSDVLSFKVNRKADADATKDDGTIAKIVTKIPVDTPEALEVTHRVSKGVLTYNSSENKPVNGFSGKITKQCEASLYIKAETAIVGAENSSFYVTTHDGKAAEGREVYLADGTLLGKTDADGKITTDAFVNSAAEYTIYAQGESERSFNYKSQSFLPGGSEDGTPTYVKLNGSSNSEKSQNITWMSSPLTSADRAVVKYAEKAAYEKDKELAFSEAEGTSSLDEMGSSGNVATNYAVRVNRADLTDLKADTEYVYCVGDGEKFSDVKTFTTKRKNTSTNFFVIGDTQATNTENTDAISKQLSEGSVKYDFGIQTGDMVDNGGDYTMWANIAKIFSGDYLGSVPVIHTLGNHESYGDLKGTNASHYFNLPEANGDSAPLCYSVQYGNVYLAVVNYGVPSDYKAAANWIKADAAKTSAQWKILVAHQPAYTTNPSGTTQAVMDIFRNLCDEVGFDIMFSGHDHSFARTKSMTGGNIDENGTTYYICGSTGEKGYDAVINEDYNFEIVRGKSTDITDLNGFNAIYLTVSADDKQLVVKAHDVNGDSDEVIDTFTKTANNECTKNGHSYLYTADGLLVCDKCGYTIKQSGFTGLVKDENTKRVMYLDNGTASKSKWETLGDDSYYFDADGLAVTGTVKIPTKMHPTVKTEGPEVPVEYTFDKDGKFIKGSFVKETVTGAPSRNATGTIKNNNANLTKEVIRYYEAGGVYAENWRQIDGNWYFFLKFGNTHKNDNGDMYRRGGEMRVQTPGNNSIRSYVFNTNGIMTRGAFEDELDADKNLIGTRYYWANEYVSNCSKEVSGHTYTFDKNGFMEVKPLASCKVKLSSAGIEYTGSEIKPSVKITDGTQTLKENTHYTVKYVNNIKPGECSVIIEGNPSRGYTGKMELAFDITAMDMSKLTVTGVNNAIYTGKAITQKLTVKNGSITLKENTDYTVSYKNNVNEGTATVILTAVKGSGYTGTKQVTFKISKADISKANVSLKSEVIYTGKAITPAVTVKNGNTTLKNGTDYTVSYKNSTNIGTATVTVTGKGNYAGTKTATFKIVLAKPTNLKSTQSASAVKLTWNKASGVDSYGVYVFNTKTGKYKSLATVTGTSYTVKNLKAGTTYKFAVRGNKKIGSKTFNSSNAVGSATTKFTKVKSLKAAQSTSAVKLSWGKVSGAANYDVYQKIGGKWKKIATTKSTSYTIGKLKVGTTYDFAVRANKVAGKTTIYGEFTFITTATKPDKVKFLKASTSKNSVKLSWGKVSGATSYGIYRYDAKTKSYKGVKTVTGTSYTDIKLKSGTTYKYIVRANKIVGKTKIYGASSDAKSVKVK